jgi:hypothetical protein
LDDTIAVALDSSSANPSSTTLEYGRFRLGLALCLLARAGGDAR